MSSGFSKQLDDSKQSRSGACHARKVKQGLSPLSLIGRCLQVVVRTGKSRLPSPSPGKQPKVFQPPVCRGSSNGIPPDMCWLVAAIIRRILKHQAKIQSSYGLSVRTLTLSSRITLTQCIQSHGRQMANTLLAVAMMLLY